MIERATRKRRGSTDPYRKQRLTDRIVDALPPPERGSKIAYDDRVVGFGVRVTAAAARAFILNYYDAHGEERRWTIGRRPEWSTSAAREAAKQLKVRIDGGFDPLAADREQREAPTVDDLNARFLEEHVARLRPRTQNLYRSVLQNDLLPAFGRRKIAAIEHEDCDRLHAAVSKRAPAFANRLLAVGSVMFGLAVRWKLRADNPWRGVKRNREYPKRRYLTPDELPRLNEALDADPNQDAADAFRLALLTGARCASEILPMRWADLDLGA